MNIRVLLADDHALLRSAVRALLNSEPGIEVVGEAETGQAALRLAAELSPDVLVVDLNMPDGDGFEVARTLSRGAGSVAVVVMSARVDAGVRARLRESSSQVVSKHAALVDLVPAIRAAVSNRAR
jgi:DNA-binding NarL/FixJ family response regulator